MILDVTVTSRLSSLHRNSRGNAASELAKSSGANPGSCNPQRETHGRAVLVASSSLRKVSELKTLTPQLFTTTASLQVVGEGA